MPVINNTNVYNYYLSTYANNANRNSRYDNQKKSELRDHYNRVVKSNKESPLYKVKMASDDVTKFAIDLKENARAAQSLISSLSTSGDSIESLYNKKFATSSNEGAVHVEYIGDDDDSSTSDFEIGVRSLATPQVNTGNFMDSNGRSFETGTYSFDLDTPSNSYEFQFNVMDGDTNLNVQNRIARLFNTSDVSLSATVLPGGGGTSALSITSKQTGLSDNEEYLFKISSDTSWREIEMLGISEITFPATNSSFTLNGKERTSLSNTFTINDAFEITIKSTTTSDARIGFKSSTEAVVDSVESMVGTYNNFLEIGRRYSDIGGNNQLTRELTAVYHSFGTQLSEAGIVSDEDGTLSVDRAKLSDSLSGEDTSSSFEALNAFKNALERQSLKTAVNPMDYVDKITVAYKNPSRTFGTPYANSRYAGLLVDQSL